MNIDKSSVNSDRVVEIMAKDINPEGRHPEDNLSRLCNNDFFEHSLLRSEKTGLFIAIIYIPDNIFGSKIDWDFLRENKVPNDCFAFYCVH